MVVDFIQVALTALGAAGGVAMIMAKLVDKWLGERFSGMDNLLNERFKSIELRMNEMHTTNQRDILAWQRVERDLFALRAELPANYVRRPDFDRIEAKLDEILKARHG